MKRYRSVKLNTDIEENDEIVLSEDFGGDFGEEMTFAEEPDDEVLDDIDAEEEGGYDEDFDDFVEEDEVLEVSLDEE